MGSPTKDKSLLVRSVSEIRHRGFLQIGHSWVLDQMLNADCCRVVRSWNYPVLHRDRVQRHRDLEARNHRDRNLRVQAVVMSSQNPMLMADFALLALVEVEAAAGKKSLQPCCVVRR